jgi:hypothetical protein
MGQNMSDLITTVKKGLGFGLPIGLGAGLLDTLLRGFHPETWLDNVFFCSLGALLGAFSHQWLAMFLAARKSGRSSIGTSGEGI